MPSELTALRASSLLFILPDGTEFTIPPPSLQQAADCLRLDPKQGAPAETERERIIRLHRQATILLGSAHAHLTGKLTLAQVAELVQALYLAGVGVEPSGFVAYLQFIRDQRQRSAEEALADIERMTIDLAVELKITPAQAAQMPVADALSYRDTSAKAAHDRARFDAALHGTTLQ